MTLSTPLVFALALVSVPAVAQRVPTTADVVAHVSPAIVVVHALDREGRLLAQGSGFFIGSSGHVITNLHVVYGADHVMIERDGGRRNAVVSFLAADSDHDLVLLPTDANDAVSLDLANSDSLMAGADLVVVGAPLGFRQTVTTGTLSGITAVDGVSWLQFSALVSEGSSGSPVLNSQGNVIGVVVARRRDAPQLSFAVPSNTVRDLLQRTDTARALSELPSGAQTPTTDQRDRPSPFMAPSGLTGFYRFASLSGYTYEYAWLVENPDSTITGAVFAPHATGFVDVYPVVAGRVPGRRRGFDFRVGCVLFEGWLRDDGTLAGDIADAELCTRPPMATVPFDAHQVASDPARTGVFEGFKFFRLRGGERDSTDAWLVVVGPRQLGEGTVGAMHVWGDLPSGPGRADLFFPRGRSDSNAASLETVDFAVRVALTEARGRVEVDITLSPDSTPSVHLRGYRSDLALCLDAARDSALWRSRREIVADSLRDIRQEIRAVEAVLSADSLRLRPEEGVFAQEAQINHEMNAPVRRRREPVEVKRTALVATQARLESERRRLDSQLDASRRCPA